MCTHKLQLLKNYKGEQETRSYLNAVDWIFTIIDGFELPTREDAHKIKEMHKDVKEIIAHLDKSLNEYSDELLHDCYYKCNVAKYKEWSLPNYNEKNDERSKTSDCETKGKAVQ